VTTDLQDIRPMAIYIYCDNWPARHQTYGYIHILWQLACTTSYLWLSPHLLFG